MASLFSVFFVGMTFIFPIIAVIYIYTQKENLGTPFTESRFGALYEGVRHHNDLALMYTVTFLIRRMIISFNILYMGNVLNGPLQIMIYICACTGQLSFLCTARPMTEPLYNYLEIFNEAIVWLVSFHLLMFTEFVPDPEMR